MRRIRDVAGALTPRHWFLLWVLGAASFFEGYDLDIVTVALPQIRETFGLTQATASIWLSVLYLGALPALFVSRWADRLGRRRVLLFSLTCYTVATGLTAFTPDIATYAAAQFVARLFLNAETAIVWTMVAEELPADSRGFGFGWLAMLTALGAGMSAILYAVAFHPNNLSWRWLYVVGIPPLLAITFLRRRLPESRRFEAARADGRLARHWHEIVRAPHRRWLFLVCLTAFLGALATQIGVFTIDFMQTERGLSVAASNLILVAAGLPGIPVFLFAGTLSDHYGRKIVGCSFSVLGFLGAIGFFFGPAHPASLWAFLALTFIGQMGAWPTLGAYGTELFPTALRSQAGAWATVFRVTGQFVSFQVGALLITALHGLPRTALVLGAGPLVTVFVFALFFPATHGRELEDITDDHAPLPPI